MQTFLPPGMLHQKIGEYCDQPYPYRETQSGGSTPYANDSWNTTTAARLYANPLAYFTKEPDWQWFRDLAFNSLYLADETTSSRITMNIKAEAEDGGSRGWGYWNTTLDPIFMQFAWFMEITSLNPAPSSEVWMMTVKGGDGDDAGFCLTPLDKKYSVYDWHQYQVVWSADAVEYYVDEQRVARHENFVPDIGMAFHNWVDNRNYSSNSPSNFPLHLDKTNYINTYSVDEKHHTGTDRESSSQLSEPLADGNKTVCSRFNGLSATLLQDGIRQILQSYH